MFYFCVTMAKDKTKIDRLPPLDLPDFLGQPHDRYVRFALQIRDLALEFLQFSLDDQIKNLINWDSFQISKDSFIDEKLKAHYSDICYSGFTHSNEPFRIATLIEHKSNPPGKGEITVQLNRYILNMWQDDLNNKRQLTLTIPIVLYHGGPGLTKETTNLLFSTAPRFLHTFIPSFDYILVDLSTLTDEAIEALRMIYLGKFLTALKHSRDDDFIALYWKKFVIFAPKPGSEKTFVQFSTVTALYLNATSTIFNEKLKDMDNLLTTEEKVSAKPYLFELYDKALEKGIEQGIEKAIRLFLHKNPEWTDQQVAESFDVNPSFVQKIRMK